eukprot:10016118-Prorocentrum_lima.AAC.1
MEYLELKSYPRQSWHAPVMGPLGVCSQTCLFGMRPLGDRSALVSNFVFLPCAHLASIGRA